MKWLGSTVCMVVGLVALAALAVSLGAAAARTIPGAVDTERVRFEVVSIRFLRELEGTGARFNQSKPETYRGALVTLRVTKPVGMALKLHAADVALHYWYGDTDYDVAPCHGVSAFSLDDSSDRPMTFYERGYGGASTGPKATEASTVYVDVFFENMESGTSDCWLTIGRPIGPAYHSSGWTP